MRKNLISSLAVMMLLLLGLPTSSAHAQQEGDFELVASATSHGVRLEAKYRESLNDGLIDQMFELRVDHAPPNVTFFVAINGETVAQLRTDDSGQVDLRVMRDGVKADKEGRPVGQRINEEDVVRIFVGQRGLDAVFTPA